MKKILLFQLFGFVIYGIIIGDAFANRIKIIENQRDAAIEVLIEMPVKTLSEVDI